MRHLYRKTRYVLFCATHEGVPDHYSWREGELAAMKEAMDAMPEACERRNGVLVRQTWRGFEAIK